MISDIDNDFIIIHKDDIENIDTDSKQANQNLDQNVPNNNFDLNVSNDNYDKNILNNSNKKLDPLLAFQILHAENIWNYWTTRKYLHKWRNYRIKLYSETKILNNWTNIQNRKMLMYWKKYAKNFSKLKKINNENNNENNNEFNMIDSNIIQLNDIIIENDNCVNNIIENNSTQHPNIIKEKEETILIPKDNCIDNCIELIIENFFLPIKNFFNDVNNYCSPKISELYNNFINSFNK